MSGAVLRKCAFCLMRVNIMVVLSHSSPIASAFPITRGFGTTFRLFELVASEALEDLSLISLSTGEEWAR